MAAPICPVGYANRMNRDKEPEKLASISLSADEIQGRQRTTNAPVARRAPVQSETRPPVLLWALVIVLFALVMFLLVQMNQVKKQSDLQLQGIQVLQTKLTSTDEQANLSVDAIKILLKEQDHEIRKLWDVSNKRNRTNIEKNKERLDDQNKLITQHGREIEQTSKVVDGQAKTMKTLSASVDAGEKQVDDLKKAQADLKAQILKTEKAVAGLPTNIKSELDALAKQLKELNRAVDAMDATRLTHNRRISDLEKAVKANAAPPAASPAVPVP